MANPLEDFLHSKAEIDQGELMRSMGVDPSEMRDAFREVRQRRTRSSVDSVLEHQKRETAQSGANSAA